MFKDALRPTWVEIDLSNLEYNIKQIREKVGDRQIIGIVKGDAYGHGAIRCAQVMREKGIQLFAVANLIEALELRKAGIKEDIIILDMIPNMYAEYIVDNDFIPAICTYEGAKCLNDYAKEKGKVARGLIALDTGMGRIGYLTDEKNTDFSISDIKRINALSNFRIAGIFSHISTADEKNKFYAKKQKKQFDEFCTALEKEGVKIDFKTIANSASIIDLEDTYLDAVRPGIILYGLYPSDQVNKEALSIKPLMSVKSNITYLKTVGEGYGIGYGRTYITDKESKIATLSIGYADGFSRSYSGKGEVIVKGIKCPIVGKICMDRCMVDVTEVPNVEIGDEVVIMGKMGDEEITADDIAKARGTINYEVCCNFGQKLPRVYVK